MKVEEFIAKQKHHSDNILSKLKEYDFLVLRQRKYSDIDIFIVANPITTIVFDVNENTPYIALLFNGRNNVYFKTEEEILKYVKKIPEINQILRDKKLERIVNGFR